MLVVKVLFEMSEGSFVEVGNGAVPTCISSCEGVKQLPGELWAR